jgi:hypothetical protein
LLHRELSDLPLISWRGSKKGPSSPIESTAIDRANTVAELDRIEEPATERERQIRDRALRAVFEMWRERAPGSIASFGFDFLEKLGIGPVGQPGIPYLIGKRIVRAVLLRVFSFAMRE